VANSELNCPYLRARFIEPGKIGLDLNDQEACKVVNSMEIFPYSSLSTKYMTESVFISIQRPGHEGFKTRKLCSVPPNLHTIIR
jgi:hypothetical protein